MSSGGPATRRRSMATPFRGLLSPTHGVRPSWKDRKSPPIPTCGPSSPHSCTSVTRPGTRRRSSRTTRDARAGSLCGSTRSPHPSPTWTSTSPAVTFRSGGLDAPRPHPALPPWWGGIAALGGYSPVSDQRQEPAHLFGTRHHQVALSEEVGRGLG